MKAVARLVWSYFMGSLVTRICTFAGIALIVAAAYILVTQPQSDATLWFAIIGMIVFFAGSGLMPVMFGRLAASHSIGILPGGRLKLLLSAFVTVMIVSIPAGLVAPVAFVAGNSGNFAEVAKNPYALQYTLQMAMIVFTSAMLFAGCLYLALWLVSRQRDLAGFSKGLLVIAIVIFLPARDIQDLTMSLSWNLLQIAISWLVFGAGFLLWPRFKAVRARRGRDRSAGFSLATARGTAGREFDLMLGTANPWLLVASFVVPLVIATKFADGFLQIWLFFLTIFSTVSGAIAGEAAGRSRALWLRGSWTRAGLFNQVERSFWRHNSIVLGSLVVILLGIGSYAGLSATMLAVGLPLLILGTVLSTYVGLMITRGLRWPEVMLGIGVMFSLMAIAVIAREREDLVMVVALLAGLAVLAITLRFVAKRRWTRIDWMLCRPDRSLAARGA
jgi:hypothetical protein